MNVKKDERKLQLEKIKLMRETLKQLKKIEEHLRAMRKGQHK